MGIRKKAMALFVSTAILMLLGFYTALYVTIFHNSRDEEIELTRQNILRAEIILYTKLDSITYIATDWANWDDLYYFAKGTNPRFETEYLSAKSIAGLNINVAAVYDRDMNILAFKTVDIAESSYTAYTKDFMNTVTSAVHILKGKLPGKSASGFVSTPDGVMMISVRPSRKTDGSGDDTGVIAFGRYVDSNIINDVKNLSSLSVSMYPAGKTAVLSVPLRTALNAIRSGISHLVDQKYFILPENEETVSGYSIISDIEGKPSLLMKVSGFRYIYNQDMKAARLFLFSFFLCVIVLFAISSYLLNITVLKRLEDLNRFLLNTGATLDTSRRIDDSGSDEISSLASATNKMLGEIDHTHSQLKYLSFNDKLTGVNNRAFFELELEKLNESDRTNYSIIMGDMNGTKIVNDTFGRSESDRLLCRVADILRESCDHGDVVSRWGGDEFVMIIFNCDEQRATQICRDIRTKCENTLDCKIKPSIALGSATAKDESQKPGLLLKIAEDRMFRNKLLESKSSRNSMISSLERALRESSNETEEHTRRIKELAIKLGRRISLTANEIDELVLLATLHDIGKIGIPDNILSKPGKLTPEEWDIMKSHSEIGYRIALSITELGHIAESILAHHERYDGTGYPQGLKGEEIPMLARIITVLDSFDVMTHSRPYKTALTYKEAITELDRCSGTQFDPLLTASFIKLLAEDADSETPEHQETGIQE